jgi:ribose transport system permease protein
VAIGDGLDIAKEPEAQQSCYTDLEVGMSRPTEKSNSTETASPIPSLGKNLRRFAAKEAVALLAALLLLLVVFSISSPHFLNVGNMLNIGRSVAIMGISAAGVTIGLIGGVFDLSIASVADVTAVVTSIIHLNYGVAPIPAMLVGLLVGISCGFLNGIIVTKLRINPIIGTLATAGIFRGIAFLLTNGQSHAGWVAHACRASPPP